MRQAIDDANAGTTQIAKRAATSARISNASPGIDPSKTGLEAGIDVAMVTTEALNQANKLYQGYAAQEAAMRQGTQEGVNAVDAANKRGKFMSFLFGQDAGYSTAVGIATKNFAQNEYLKQMSTVEDNIDKTPEEYQQYLNDTVTQKIEKQYEGDPTAKEIAMSEWVTQSRKLAREQTAKHMVYAQEQTFAEGVRDLTGQFDGISLNLQQGSTPEAQQEAISELQEILKPSYRYVAEDGSVASTIASRNIQLKAVTSQLAAGNFAVLKAIPEDFREGLTVTQMDKLDQSFQQYDNAQARAGELIVEEGLLYAEGGNIAGVQQAIQQLHLQKNKLSGSVTSREKWAEDRRRLEKVLNSAVKKQAAGSVDMNNAMNYYKAREEGDAGAAGQFYSKKAQKQADDYVVMMAAGNAAQEQGAQQPKTVGEAINYVLNDVGALTSVATRAERYGSMSTAFAESVKQRILNIRPDEFGYIGQEDLAQLDNLRVLYDKAPGAMRKALGTDGSALLEITLANSREPIKEIQHKRTQFIKNKGVTPTKANFNIPSSMTMNDFVEQQLGEKYADPATVAYYSTQLKTGYQIYDGDTKAAINYMKQQAHVNNLNYKGKVVKNAGLIGTDVSLSLRQLEDTGMAAALIQTRIPETIQGKQIRGFNELQDVQYSINPGTRDMTITSSEFSFPIVIGVNELEKLAETAEKTQIELDKKQTEARLKTFEQMGQGKQMWPNPQ